MNDRRKSWRDLTLAKREVLRTAADHEPMTNTRFAEALAVSTATASRHKRDLADAGLLDVAQGDPDGRERIITVTDRGRAVLEAADA